MILTLSPIDAKCYTDVISRERSMGTRLHDYRVAPILVPATGKVDTSLEVA